MDPFDVFQRLAIALAIGLLIGIERGWKVRTVSEGERTAGLRTFALTGLLGGIWGVLAATLEEGGGVAFGLAFAVFVGIFAWYRMRELQRHRTYGATTVVAAMLAFALGAFAVLGDMTVAAATGVVVTLLLALKALLHSWLQRLSWEELRAGLVLLAMSVILLPILPDRTFGPFAVLNPYEIWLMTVLIAAVSSTGYVAIKAAGERHGVILAGFSGGLVSSTATTLSFARLAKTRPANARLLTAGAVMAGATMMVRIMVVAGLFNPALLIWLMPSLVPAAIAMAVAAWAFSRSRRADVGHAQSFDLTNPFELGIVLQFGFLLAVMLFLAKAVSVLIGDAGVYALSAVSGLADVDAITLSMARLGAGDMPLRSAGLAILVAALTNTVSKTGLCWYAGGRAAGRTMTLAASAAIICGMAGFFLALWWGPDMVLSTFSNDISPP
jgi:uncharacterized membrane protein (DUF4010 family)